MKIIIKSISIATLLTLGTLYSSAQGGPAIPPSSQYANMSISEINLVNGGSNINQTAQIIYNISNQSSGTAGTGIISIGSLRAEVSFPMQFGIQGPDGGNIATQALINELENQGWDISYIETGKSGSIHVINNQAIMERAYLPLTLPVVGFTAGIGTTSISLNVVSPVKIANVRVDDDILNNDFTVITPLPIKLLSFAATPQSCGNVQINWTTSKEENVSHFEIEHSEDSKHFSKVAKVDCKNSITGNTYHLTLAQKNKLGLYRLKTVDRDGVIAYSNVSKVQLDCVNDKIALSPNPTTDFIFISNLIPSETILIYNITGQKVIETNAKEGNNQINVSHLPAGNYNVIIKDKQTIKSTFKIVKL